MLILSNCDVPMCQSQETLPDLFDTGLLKTKTAAGFIPISEEGYTRLTFPLSFVR